MHAKHSGSRIRSGPDRDGTAGSRSSSLYYRIRNWSLLTLLRLHLYVSSLFPTSYRYSRTYPDGIVKGPGNAYFFNTRDTKLGSGRRRRWFVRAYSSSTSTGEHATSRGTVVVSVRHQTGWNEKVRSDKNYGSPFFFFFLKFGMLN